MPSSVKGTTTPILITMGEPAGVGPEVAIAAFDHFGGQIGGRPLKLVGDPDIFASHAQAVIATQARARRTPGRLDAANAPAVIEAIEIAVEAALAGEAAAVVTAPIHKAVLNSAGFGFPGHTEFLAHLTGARRAVISLRMSSVGSNSIVSGPARRSFWSATMRGRSTSKSAHSHNSAVSSFQGR